MMRQSKGLAGEADIAYDIVPFRYSMSREFWVPFWESLNLPQV